MDQRKRRPGVDLELRVTVDGRMVIGPVQAMLLVAIVGTRSIAAAQRQFGCSHAHAWKLVAAMNETFSPPLVSRLRGGAGGSGTILIENGRKVLASYRSLVRLSRTRGHAELLAIGRATDRAAAEQPMTDILASSALVRRGQIPPLPWKPRQQW
jgi:molybdate transport system regulatory protein